MWSVSSFASIQNSVHDLLRYYPGAAGTFLSQIAVVSENAFKIVIEIDTMRAFLVFGAWIQLVHGKIGTFNTIKATLPYICKSRGAYIHVSATLYYLHDLIMIESSEVLISLDLSHDSAAKAGVDALSAVLEGPMESDPMSLRLERWLVYPVVAPVARTLIHLAERDL